MRGRTTGAVVLISSMLLSCGGSAPPGTVGPSVNPGGTASATSVGTQDELEAAAIAAFEAFLGADDQAFFNLLASDCRTEAGFAVVASALTQRRSRAAGDGVDLQSLSVADVTVTGFNGTTGNVALVIAGSDAPFAETMPSPWIHEAEGWRSADCSRFRTGGPGAGDAGTSADNPLQVGGIATIGGWFVVLTYVSEDFTAFVLEEPGNDPPAAGNVYAAVQMSLTFNGPDATATVEDDLDVSLQAGGSTYGPEADCGTYPQEPDFSASVQPGERQLVTLCWEVPDGAFKGALVVVTDRATGMEWWFATME